MDTLPDALQAAVAPAYQLERELEGGGMSRVFVASDSKLGRKVVVKVLPPDLAAGVNRDRFRREIQYAAQLIHPHIVQVISAGETDDLLYYTMPYIEGHSLRTELERGELSSKRVVRILRDVVDALAYAHDRGIIHRDIKPGNILTLGNHALVTDFGVAKAISSASPGSGVTSAGLAIGTPAYMAPEQLAADPAADHRVDIYAVGLLAYELLSGSSPFRQESPQATMAAQLTRIPTPLDVCCPGVSPELSNIVMKCLEKDPSARYQSARALLAGLDNLGMTSGAVSGQAIQPPLKGKGKVRNSMLIGGVVAGAAVVAAGFAFLANSESPPAIEPVMSSTPQSVVIAPDSTVFPPAAPPAAPPVARPRVLTRSDSLAIANALRATGTGAAAAAAAPMAVAPMAASPIAAASVRSNVVIMPPRPMPQRPDLTEASRSFAEDLRKALLSGGNYTVVSPDAMRRARMQQGDPRIAMNALNADLVVTMSFVGNEPRSLAIQMRDTRTGRTSSVLVLGAERGTLPIIRNSDAGIREVVTRLDALVRN